MSVRHIDIETDPEALPSAIRNAEAPIAFLVGAPLSAPLIPGVGETVARLRKMVELRDETKLRTFDQKVSGAAAPDQYQAAMSFVRSFFGQRPIDRVIADMVREAFHKPTGPSPKDDEEREALTDHWRLTPGVEALGALLARAPDRFAGPVLTTNFDPLISVAVRKAGGTALQIVLEQDGSLDQADLPGAVRVVHLHGFWRGRTLHTPWQLNAARDRLQASLEQLLRDRVLVVMAYGGWDDVFTRALATFVREGAARADVLWTFYDDDPARIRQQNERLLGALEPASTQLRFYAGVDAHRLLPALREAFAPPPRPKVAPPPPAASPIRGWTLVDPAFLAGHAVELGAPELVQFYNGQVPAWRHAVSLAIPARERVGELVGAFEAARGGDAGICVRLILGPGGEGKSTMLLQTAGRLAASGGFRVLYRPDPATPLTAEDVGRLDRAGAPWLLVADEAESLARDLPAVLRLLHGRSGRRDVHLLLASRDSDWLASGGRNALLNQLADYRELRVHGLSEGDAALIVRAWGAAGEPGLGALAGVKDETARVRALVEAARREAVRVDEGAFFGAMLKVRFAESLRDHLRELLQRLGDRPLPGGRTLRDAFFFIAAPQAVGISGIDVQVLAEILRLTPAQVGTYVRFPLGEEAAATATADALLVRHRTIAEHTILLAEEFGVDLPDLYASLVRGTLALPRRGERVTPTLFNATITCSSRFVGGKAAIFPTGRPDVARAAALALARGEERVEGLVHACSILRKAGFPEEAVSCFREAITRVDAWPDRERRRKLLFEWSVAEGECGRPALSVWLAGVSIADRMGQRLDMERVRLSLTGLCGAQSALVKRSSEAGWARGLRAVSAIGLGLEHLDLSDQRFFQRYKREADLHHAPPMTPTEALAVLPELVRAAWSHREEELNGVPPPDRLRFGELAALLGLEAAPTTGKGPERPPGR